MIHQVSLTPFEVSREGRSVSDETLRKELTALGWEEQPLTDSDKRVLGISGMTRWTVRSPTSGSETKT